MRKPTLDDVDVLILLEIEKGASVREIARATGKSNTTIQGRLETLEKYEYITPPPQPRMARSRQLTQKGQDFVSGLRNPATGTIR